MWRSSSCSRTPNFTCWRRAARIHKERAMRRRQLKRLCGRLGRLAAMRLKREDLLMKLGAARAMSVHGQSAQPAT